MLSDIPVTFDPEIFRDGSFDIKRPVTLQVEAVTFNEAFELLLAKDGLSIRPTQTGIVIAKPASNRTFTKSYPQSFCADENACRRLRELIIAATGINDWDAEERFQLEVLPGSVTVSHFPSHQQQIAALLQKLNAAAKYNVAPAVMRQQLQPLAMMAEDALTAAPGLDTSNPFRRSMRIGSLFRSVRQSTDLVTVIDWENLSKQGWYPNTKIPGRVNESTNRKLLNQLGHAMEATSVVVGPKTVMLTTFENAGKQIDVEVYSVGDVIDNKMTPAQLDQLMTETLGVDQLTPPNAIVIYFAECKCLVASAPQIIQRQISAIVNVL